MGFESFEVLKSDVRGPTPNSEVNCLNRTRPAFYPTLYQDKKFAKMSTMHVLTSAVSGNALNIRTRAYVDWMKKS